MANGKTDQPPSTCACGRTAPYYFGVQAAANALMDIGHTNAAIDMAKEMGGAAKEAVNIAIFLRAPLDPEVYAAVWLRMNGGSGAERLGGKQ